MCYVTRRFCTFPRKVGHAAERKECSAAEEQVGSPASNDAEHTLSGLMLTDCLFCLCVKLKTINTYSALSRSVSKPRDVPANVCEVALMVNANRERIRPCVVLCCVAGKELGTTRRTLLEL